ncbi:hypothetical protein LCGC14_2950830, partial [marine sediment metagenome]
GMSINSAGTILYVGGIGAANENFLKYTIATDAYDVTGSIGANYEPMYASDRNARLWITYIAGGNYYYWNCDTDVKTAPIFEPNPQETVQGHYAVIYNGDKAILGWVRTGAEPTIMSYFGTGTWKLAKKFSPPTTW